MSVREHSLGRGYPGATRFVTKLSPVRPHNGHGAGGCRDCGEGATKGQTWQLGMRTGSQTLVTEGRDTLGCCQTHQVAFLLDKGRSHPRGYEDDVSSFSLEGRLISLVSGHEIFPDDGSVVDVRMHLLC